MRANNSMSGRWQVPAVCVMISLFSMFSSVAVAFEWKDLWQRKDQQARALLDAGNAEQAAEVFTDHQWRGVSHFEAGNFEQAIEAFNADSNAADRYNQGVAEVMAGAYEAASASFESVLQARPDDEDAAHNLAIAKELAKQQQNQQQNQQEPQNGDQSDDGQSEQSSPDGSDQDDNNQDPDQQGDSGDSQSPSDTDSSESAESSQQPSDDTPGDSSPGDTPPAESAQQQGELDDQSVESAQRTDTETDEQALEALQQSLREDASASAEDTPDTNDEPSPQGVPAGTPVNEEITEENQATEQWLRRIPDDPSQLLRNKIKLNHLLEHPDVGDTPEPW